ncbi:MAG: hypothetical protein HYZ28_09475 [Myxococcales bacterium]|nr:hypothetical protein [Myxococcales bacterium]
MSPGPRPTPLELPIRNERDVEFHRNLYCRFYDQCLDFSVKESWASWTCHHCPLFGSQEDAPRAREFAERRNREQPGP